MSQPTRERASVRSQKTTKITLQIGNRRGAVQVPQRAAEILVAAVHEAGLSLEDFLLEQLSGALFGSTSEALRGGDRYGDDEIDAAARDLLELSGPWKHFREQQAREARA